jgi:hypothetical protein
MGRKERRREEVGDDDTWRLLFFARYIFTHDVMREKKNFFYEWGASDERNRKR